jgi:hypothetical protein
MKITTLVWALTIVMVGVFINELVVNIKAQGTPVSFKVCNSYMSIIFVIDFSSASCKPYAWAVRKCIDQFRCSFPAMHEIY